LYSELDLKKYDYFEGSEINYVLDSLTGVISRQYILDYAKRLIEKKIPFAMCMIDLDNFKYINDNYGHNSGDICLKDVAEALRVCVGDDGLVGRFGGDEFIIVYTKANDYDSIHDFLARLYTQDGAVRKYIYLDKVRVFLTATMGCASYPNDAKDYDELFLKMDKALYRGKIKGRNCYIIYVHEKHKDIIVKERGGNSLLSKLQDIEKIVDEDSGPALITHITDYLYRVLHPFNAIIIDKKNNIQSGNDTRNYYFGNNAYFMLDKMLKHQDVFPSSNPGEIIEKFPETTNIIVSRKIHAFVVVRIKKFGFIIIYENNVTRMWQDFDLALLYFAANLLKDKLEKEQNK